MNAILVDVYNFLRVYRYFSRYSLTTKHTTFLSSTASFVHRSFSFSHHLTLPKVESTFQMTGRHDLIGSSWSVEIFEAASGSSTSGSKSYFLFKLHDPTSGESGRQQQLTTRLSSCILDMCELAPATCRERMFYESKESMSHESWVNETHSQYSNNLLIKPKPSFQWLGLSTLWNFSFHFTV